MTKTIVAHDGHEELTLPEKQTKLTSMRSRAFGHSFLPATQSFSKEELRKLLRDLAGQQDQVRLSMWESRILSSLENTDEFKNARTVLMYSSLDGEVPTLNFIRKWARIKQIVLPRVISADEMELRKYVAGKTVEGEFSIMEPDFSCDKVLPEELDLAVIPGVAFAPLSENAPKNSCEVPYARLGRGKGYYDRLLTKLNCPTIGICFPYRILNSIPREAHDQVVDKCIY